MTSMKNMIEAIIRAALNLKNQPMATQAALWVALSILFFIFFLPSNGAFYVLLVLLGFWLPKRDAIYILAVLVSIPAWFNGGDLIQRGTMLISIGLAAFIVSHLWNKKALLKAIVDTAAEGIITIDAKGIITSFNKMAETIFDYASDEVIGQNISILMPSPWKENHDAYIAQYLKSGEAKVLGKYREVQGIRKDGECFPLMLGVSEVKFGHKPVFTGVVRDISQRKRNEATIAATHAELEARSNELIKANEELSQFAHVVSHDLKAPLRAIRNYSDWLSEDLKGSLSDDHQEYIAGLQQAVNQAETLIEDLLELSKIGRKENRLETIVLNHFFDRLIASLHLEPEAVEFFIDKNLPAINSSPVLLTQIFQNLILNGVKYNHADKKQIHIGYRNNQDTHEVTILDNGIGIDAKYHANIFDIFQRLHTREEYEGTGIGLAIVKKAAHQLGYTIRLESKLGEGSSFTLCIPQERI